MTLFYKIDESSINAITSFPLLNQSLGNNSKALGIRPKYIIIILTCCISHTRKVLSHVANSIIVCKRPTQFITFRGMKIDLYTFGTIVQTIVQTLSDSVAIDLLPGTPLSLAEREALKKALYIERDDLYVGQGGGASQQGPGLDLWALSLTGQVYLYLV